MTFVTAGLAIAGIAAMTIPIIIHLLSRQRRKPVEWAAMRFLFEAFRKHRRRLRVEQLLLLLARCLAVLLLGLALARPILEGAMLLDAGGGRTVHFIIDNGIASGIETSPGRTALDEHIDQAISIIRALDAGDRIGIITAALPARALLSPPSRDHRGVMNLLRAIEPSDAATDLAGAMRSLGSQLDMLDKSHQRTLVYLLSEFRAGSAPLDNPLPAALPSIAESDHRHGLAFFASAPATTPIDNVQITAVEPVRYTILPSAADGSGQITVRLARQSATLDRAITRVSLTVAARVHSHAPQEAATQPSAQSTPHGTEQQSPNPSAPVAAGMTPQPTIPPRTVTWQPGQSEATIDFLLDANALASAAATARHGGQARDFVLTASIDRDALPADNRRYATIEARQRIRVLMLDRRTFGYEPSIDRYTSGRWIRRALQPYTNAFNDRPDTNTTPRGRSGGPSPIDVVDVEPAALDIADLRTADLVIAPRPDLITADGWELLDRHTRDGGILIIVPPGELSVHSWIDALVTALDLPWRIQPEVERHARLLALADEQPPSEIFRMIASDLPDLTRPILTTQSLVVDTEQTQARVLLQFADGTPFLFVSSPARINDEAASTEAPQSTPRRIGDLAQRAGEVALFTAALELAWTNLPSKPFMVPMMHELVRQSLNAVRRRQQSTAGSAAMIAGYPSAAALVSPDGKVIPLDDNRRPPLSRAGVYTIRDHAAGSGGRALGMIAVNSDPDAARTTPQPEPAVLAWLNGSSASGAGRDGLPNWRILPRDRVAAQLDTPSARTPIAALLLAALLVLVIAETLLARWFSHAYRADDQPSASRDGAAGAIPGSAVASAARTATLTTGGRG